MSYAHPRSMRGHVAIITSEPKAFVAITTEDFALGHEVGRRASFLLMQAVRPLMVANGGGSIGSFR